MPRSMLVYSSVHLHLLKHVSTKNNWSKAASVRLISSGRSVYYDRGVYGRGNPWSFARVFKLGDLGYCKW